MKLISNYTNEVYTLAETLKNEGGTLKKLNKEIEKLSLEISEEEEKKEKENRNKFKGDIFEIFAWRFFNGFKNDPSVGLVEYKPIRIEEDYGVDGIGINANGNKVAVQVKYRRNLKDLIRYSDIAKTYTSGKLELGLDLKEKNSIYVFTNSTGITPACERVFGNMIKVLNFSAIDHYIHNNINFWNFFYEEICNYLDN